MYVFELAPPVEEYFSQHIAFSSVLVRSSNARYGRKRCQCTCLRTIYCGTRAPDERRLKGVKTSTFLVFVNAQARLFSVDKLGIIGRFGPMMDASVRVLGVLHLKPTREDLHINNGYVA